ncbi:DUF4340 domain-containing protein [bacterium]|nr:DUF4340 domain-containing protein [bacterium]
MKLLKPLLILIVLLALWAVVHFMSDRPDRPDEADVFKVQIDTTKVSRIEVSRTGGQLVLLRDQGAWSVQTPSGPRPAENDQIVSALSTLGSIQTSSLVSHNPDKQAEFQVDEASGTRVKVFGGGQEPFADIVIGRIGGFDQRRMYSQQSFNPQDFYTFMRRADSPNVFKVQGFFGAMLGTDSEQWRDHTLLAFDPAQARRVELMFPDTRAALQADTSGHVWRIEGGGAAPDSTVLRQMLGTLSSLRASTFVDSLPPADSLGLDPPQFTLRVTLADGATQGLEVGKETANNLFFCRVPGKEQVCTLARYRLDQVRKRPEELVAGAGKKQEPHPVK